MPKQRTTAPALDADAQAILEEYGRLITYPQAAEITTASVRTRKRETAAGRLPCYTVGRSRTLRVKTLDVLALVARVA